MQFPQAIVQRPRFGESFSRHPFEESRRTDQTLVFVLADAKTLFAWQQGVERRVLTCRSRKRCFCAFSVVSTCFSTDCAMLSTCRSIPTTRPRSCVKHILCCCLARLRLLSLSSRSCTSKSCSIRASSSASDCSSSRHLKRSSCISNDIHRPQPPCLRSVAQTLISRCREALSSCISFLHCWRTMSFSRISA